MVPTLVIFGGLPGTGKTAIAWELARQLGCVYLRIDSIEQAILDSGMVCGPMNDAGYRVAHSVAEDNLRLERSVVADCVNPIQLSRDAWIRVGQRAGVRSVEVEIVCSDREEHRRRVESRIGDIRGAKLPTWREVLAREYHPWNREHVTLDTTGRSVEESVKTLREALTD